MKKNTPYSHRYKTNLEANFRKLWFMEKVNIPFLLHISMLRKVWAIPLKNKSNNIADCYKNLQNFINQVEKMDDKYWKSKNLKNKLRAADPLLKIEQSQKARKMILTALLYNLPSIKLERAIRKIIDKFNFEDFWYFPLLMYLVTDHIIPPYTQKSKNIPPKHVYEDWKIMHLKWKKEAQHKFLKKEHRLKVNPKGWKEQNQDKFRYINETDLLPNKLILDNLNIAQIVFGEWDNERMSLEKLGKLDKKMINLVKKRVQRFKKYFTSLSNQDMKNLKTLKL